MHIFRAILCDCGMPDFHLCRSFCVCFLRVIVCCQSRLLGMYYVVIPPLLLLPEAFCMHGFCCRSYAHTVAVGRWMWREWVHHFNVRLSSYKINLSLSHYRCVCAPCGCCRAHVISKENEHLFDLKYLFIFLWRCLLCAWHSFAVCSVRSLLLLPCFVFRMKCDRCILNMLEMWRVWVHSFWIRNLMVSLTEWIQ